MRLEGWTLMKGRHCRNETLVELVGVGRERETSTIAFSVCGYSRCLLLH